MSKLIEVIELLKSASTDVKDKYEVTLISQNGTVRKAYESRESHLEALIKVASHLLEDYNKSNKTFGDELYFSVTKLIFTCGTEKYSLQAYSSFGDELEFGMFDTKEEVYARKNYYTKNAADYDELNLAERYSAE